MSALFDVAGRTAETPDQKIAQSLLCAGEIVSLRDGHIVHVD